MEAELVALATSGATTVVGLMATELWAQVRGRVAALFGSRAQSAAEDLDEVRAGLLAADDQQAAEADALAELAPRLRRALDRDPGQVGAELRALIAEFGQPAAEPGSMSNTISGGTFNAAVVQARDIRNLKF